MSNRFVGKNVIVTGAARGIGKAIAKRLAAEGGEIMLIGRTLTSLEDAAAEIGKDGGTAWPFQADVQDSEQVQHAVDAALERWGKIDVLINNAGIQYLRPFLDIEETEWDEVVDTNLKGPFLFSQRVARAMVKTGGGSIVHNASIDASAAEPDFASYNASKAGLQGLSRTMALDLAQYNIRSNTVSPGVTDTEMMAVEVGPQMMEYLRNSFERVPMKRLMSTEEVAAVFAFVASDEASAVTGTDITVDAGMTANLYILETLKDQESFDASQSTGGATVS